MKFLSITSLIVLIALFLPPVWAQNPGQELTSASSSRPQPAAPQPAGSQPEAFSPPKIISAYASVTKPVQNGATRVASAQTDQSQNAAAKGPGSRAPAEPDGSVFTVRKTVNEVDLVFTVTDKHG